MGKIRTWIKGNKIIVGMAGVFILGGATTAILTTCLPSYTVNKILITDGPNFVIGESKTAGTSDQYIYEIDGVSKNSGKVPNPNFAILMTNNQTLPSWLSIKNNELNWTNDCVTGVYSFILQISIDNVKSLAPFTTTLIIS